MQNMSYYCGVNIITKLCLGHALPVVYGVHRAIPAFGSGSAIEALSSSGRTTCVMGSAPSCSASFT